MLSAPMANLINAAALCLLQLRAYNESTAVAHIAVVLTMVVLIALIMPLSSRLDGSDPLGLARVVTMMLTSALAMFAFIASFRAARKAREAAGD